LGWQFAEGLLNATKDVSGWSLNLERVRPFILLSLQTKHL